MTRHILISYMVVICACLLIACEPSSSSHQVQAVEAAPQVASNSELVIRDHLKGILGKIILSGPAIRIDAKELQLMGIQKGEKRKYQDLNAHIVAEVKVKDASGFKLRNPDGSLRWKVKLYDDKVKISNNEENENPWQLKTSDGKFKLKNAADEEVGRVEKGEDFVYATSEAQQFLFEDPSQMSYGVFLIPELTLQDKLILLAELQARGY